MAAIVSHPSPGCIVEYLEGNAIQTAMVLEENSGKLRLLLPSRRETKLAANRILPWAGPASASVPGREEAVHMLEEHISRRKELASSINPLEVWELAQGDVAYADAGFFASLFEDDPDVDKIAAFGHALLACKTHFRFQPPQFQIYDAETVEKRISEKIAREERESLVNEGEAFLRKLWDLSKKRQVLDRQADNCQEPACADRIRKILHSRLLNPDSIEDAGLWQLIGKGLPDDPLLPVELLTAWGEIPRHYNFWLERAGYEPGDSWWKCHNEEVARLEQAATGEAVNILPLADYPFISIDGNSTRDIDDAFYLEKNPDGGWLLVLAFACPVFAWQFESGFDHEVRQRATSLYLPEAAYNMLPDRLGVGSYSLFANNMRPMFCIRMRISESGEISETEPFMARGVLAANLHYEDVERVIDGARDAGNPALPFAEMLESAFEMANAREKRRIADGAIVMQRLDPHISLEDNEDEVLVDISLPPPAEKAQKAVSEMMIAASAAIADYAAERNIPLVHRIQDVVVPREYAGVWKNPWDIARIMRSLVPSGLDVEAAPHAALGLTRYAPVTSPLRRYADLLNEAQIQAWLKNGQPLWTMEELEKLLNSFLPALDSASHVQRFRPRYWRLLYFQQQGEERLWEAVVTDENENYVTVAIPEKGLVARGRRNFFDERIGAGMKVNIRLGRIHPLQNDIHILEVLPQ